MGAYDNAGGVITLLWVLKWAKYGNLRNLMDKYGIIFAFVDGEERGLLGSYHLLEDKILQLFRIVGHLSLDGYGIGTAIGGFGNLLSVRLRINSKEKNLKLSADTSIFQERNIPSLHTFSLPCNELQNLVEKCIFPPSWKILHTGKDTPDKIEEWILPFMGLQLYEKLSQIDFNIRGVFTLNGC
jgi:hypothetical protein